MNGELENHGTMEWKKFLPYRTENLTFRTDMADLSEVNNLKNSHFFERVVRS